MRTRGLMIAGCLGFALGFAGAARRARRQSYSFRGRTVVITGGSRGLGLELARVFAAEGATLALVARDPDALVRARQELEAGGARVLAVPCDVREPGQVERAVRHIVARFGRIDVLVNNAGAMLVAPLKHLTPGDFEDAMALHWRGPLAMTLAVLPHLRRAGGGRIVNIASIGGKIAVPHMLPYTASKFALVGLSDGLRAELRREGILVTTVCPGPMRTGSHRNALFKGRHRREFAWFALADSLPVVSVDSRRAARAIVSACRRGSARLLLGITTRAAVMFNELMPEASAVVMAAANRLLPRADASRGGEVRPGHASESAVTRSMLTALSRRAAARNNERPIGLVSAAPDRE